MLCALALVVEAVTSQVLVFVNRIVDLRRIDTVGGGSALVMD